MCYVQYTICTLNNVQCTCVMYNTQYTMYMCYVQYTIYMCYVQYTIHNVHVLCTLNNVQCTCVMYIEQYTMYMCYVQYTIHNVHDLQFKTIDTLLDLYIVLSRMSNNLIILQFTNLKFLCEQVVIDEFTLPVMNVVLQYIHTGSCYIITSHLPSLMAAADRCVLP